MFQSKIKSDITKLVCSSLASITGVKDDIKNTITSKLEDYIGSINIVTREEYDVQKMQIEKLQQELDELKKYLKK